MSASKKRSRAVSLSVDWDKIVKVAESSAESASKYGGAGTIEYERPTVEFCTGSSYNGKWNAIGMAGFGEYTFPHGVVYEGGMEDGMFHGEGTLTYPMGQKLEGIWHKGKLVNYKFINSDGLDHQTPWSYCKMPDRRFNVSIREGLQPAGREFLTNQQPTRVIEEGCYDTVDGFYNPVSRNVMRARDPQDYEFVDEDTVKHYFSDEDADFWGNYVQMVSPEQEQWITKYCRKAWDEPAGYRPEFYEEWVTGRRDELEKVDERYLVRSSAGSIADDDKENV